MEKEGDTKCLVLKQEEQDDTNKPADQKKTGPSSEGEANQKQEEKQEKPDSRLTARQIAF